MGTNDEQPRLDADFAEWPMVFVQCEGVVSDEAHYAFLEQLESQAAARGGPFSLVLDLRYSNGLSMKQRARQMDQLERLHSEGFRCASIALVMRSALMRGMLTAMRWVSKAERPLEYFAEPGEAVNWTRDHLREASRALDATG